MKSAAIVSEIRLRTDGDERDRILRKKPHVANLPLR
jgi:hypothetical protein